jgi:hypothetical protein
MIPHAIDEAANLPWFLKALTPRGRKRRSRRRRLDVAAAVLAKATVAPTVAAPICANVSVMNNSGYAQV